MDGAHERRLSRAVRAEQAEAVACADKPGRILDHGLERGVCTGRDRARSGGTGAVRADISGSPICHRIPDRRVEHIDDLLAQTRHGKAFELELVTCGWHIGDELARSFHTELGLARARLRPAAQPCELLACHVAAALLGDRSHAVALHALQDICGVSTLERVDTTVVDLPHAETDLVQKPTVVRDNEKRSAPPLPTCFEVLGEPVDRTHVEVICGLIEHQHVVVADQKARKVDAATLTARKLADPALPGDVGDQPVDRLAHAGVRRPFVLGRVPDDRVMHGLVVAQAIGLAEQPHAQVATMRDAPVVGLDRTRQNRQQRGLAVAVFTDDTDAVAVGHAQRDRIENMLGGKLERNRVAP